MNDGLVANAAGASAPAAPPRRRGRRRSDWRRRRLVLVLMSPWIIGFSVFFGYPLVMSAYLSFNHYDLLSSPRWVGLANYRYMFNVDPQFWTSVKNTLIWMVGIAVPLQVLFAFVVAATVARIKSGGGVFRTIFYLPALAPPVAATLGFVYILNPATGPVNTILGHLGITGPLWFQDPAWSKPSLIMLGMWGIGNVMVIFLAAVLDVPQHLYESAELDGAGPFQRLRWVTLPTISPVLLFAVVLGVIQGLQYFTQAYVAAGVAAGQASQAADVTSVNLGYPLDSTLFYPDPALRARVQRVSDGLRVGARDAAARRLVRGHARDRPELPQVGAPGGAAVTDRARRRPARPSSAAGRRPRVRRRRLVNTVATHAVLIALAIAFLAAVRLHHADGADDERAGAVVPALAASVPVPELHRRLHDGAAAALDVQHDGLLVPRDARRARVVGARSPTRSRACAGAAATSRSWSCWSR